MPRARNLFVKIVVWDVIRFWWHKELGEIRLSSFLRYSNCIISALFNVHRMLKYNESTNKMKMAIKMGKKKGEKAATKKTTRTGYRKTSA